MKTPRDIDNRDLDRLLSALSDDQLARLFEMHVGEVRRLRRERLGWRGAGRQPDQDR